MHKISQGFDSRRRQATAIVMLGVLGAEFGAEIEPNRRKTIEESQKNNTNAIDGFGPTKYSHAMHTSECSI